LVPTGTRLVPTGTLHGAYWDQQLHGNGLLVPTGTRRTLWMPCFSLCMSK
jgi:hypothetical protein